MWSNEIEYTLDFLINYLISLSVSLLQLDSTLLPYFLAPHLSSSSPLLLLPSMSSINPFIHLSWSLHKRERVTIRGICLTCHPSPSLSPPPLYYPSLLHLTPSSPSLHPSFLLMGSGASETHSFAPHLLPHHQLHVLPSLRPSLSSSLSSLPNFTHRSPHTPLSRSVSIIQRSAFTPSIHASFPPLFFNLCAVGCFIVLWLLVSLFFNIFYFNFTGWCSFIHRKNALNEE